MASSVDVEICGDVWGCASPVADLPSARQEPQGGCNKSPGAAATYVIRPLTLASSAMSGANAKLRLTKTQNHRTLISHITRKQPTSWTGCSLLEKPYHHKRCRPESHKPAIALS